MSISFYMDHHVRSAVTRGLRRRGVDVLTAYEDGFDRAADEAILERATALGRVVYTHDEDYLEIAHRWQRMAKAFAGIVFCEMGGLSVGRQIEYLELIAEAAQPKELANAVQFIPLQ